MDRLTTKLTVTNGGLPISTVEPLPVTTTTASFTVSWTGSPGASAPGIASYEIFVSDDGGPFTIFLADTTLTSATFTGQFSHTYEFYSVATDNLGNVQPNLMAAQATISVIAPPPLILTNVQDVKKRNKVTEIVITFSRPLNEAEADNKGVYQLKTPGTHGYLHRQERAVLSNSARRF